MDNLEEMDNLLQNYKLPKLNQEKIENLTRLITSTEIETVIKNLPTNKSPGPYGFTGAFYQKFREKLIPTLLKLFQKIAEEVLSSVQFSCSVVSNSLRPHELQHVSPPCPSPTPGVYSNSFPSSL